MGIKWEHLKVHRALQLDRGVGIVAHSAVIVDVDSAERVEHLVLTEGHHVVEEEIWPPEVGVLNKGKKYNEALFF